MQYLIYDVETPNRHNDSICACAWLLHDGTKELDFGCQLINPQADFDLVNISIHRLCEDDVCNAPTFGEYWESTLKELFAHSTVVAHNASFDISVTTKALSAAGIDVPEMDYIDTMSVLRSLLPIGSSKLCDLAAHYGIQYKQHDAGADVRALNDVLEHVRKEKGFNDYTDLFSVASRSSHGNASAKTSRRSRWEYEELLAKVVDNARSKGVDFTDIHFAFHGDLKSPAIERKNGLDRIIEALGGHFHSNITKKVDYYVCFSDTVTGTYKKALALTNDPSTHILIIDTEAFLALLGYETNAPDLDGPRLIRERKHKEEASKPGKKESGGLPACPVFGGYDYQTIYENIVRIIGEGDDDIKLNLLKTGASIFMFGSQAFTIRINSRSQFLDSKLEAAREFVDRIHGASYASEASHFPISASAENYDAVREMLIAIYNDRYEAQTGVAFGCCNDFIRCSDAGHCLKAKDPDYIGCQYRKNLEAGRIFYGKNRNVD